MEKIPNDCPILLPDGEHDINLLMHGCTQAGRISPATHRTLLGTALGTAPVAALVFLGCSALSFGCGEDPLKGPPREIAQTTVKLSLPEAPAFDIPGPHPDGTHSVREMRLKSSKLLNTEVQIKGFVTWVYDCVAEHQSADETIAETRKKVEADPTMCQRPHFFLGDTADTSGERSIWVVEVPRKLRSDEVRLLSRQERANLPKVPDINIGDEVIVTGSWANTSPGGFTKSEGLLVYKDLQNLSGDTK